MLLGKVGAQHIKAREHPAAARTALVVNLLLGSLVAEVGVNRAFGSIILGQVVDRVGGNGIEERLVLSRCRLSLADGSEHIIAEPAVMLLRRGGNRSHQRQSNKKCLLFHHRL